jgi:formylmethanofuran dehydrogenase subunit E
LFKKYFTPVAIFALALIFCLSAGGVAEAKPIPAADPIKVFDGGKTHEINLSNIEKYHGHLCGGVAIGYRACQEAIKELWPDGTLKRGDVLVISGSDTCPLDVLQFVTGTRYGPKAGIANGRLILDKSINQGNASSFIFVRLSDGKALKLSMLPFDQVWVALDQKSARGELSAKDKKLFTEKRAQLEKDMYFAPLAKVFTVQTLKNFSVPILK